MQRSAGAESITRELVQSNAHKQK